MRLTIALLLAALLALPSAVAARDDDAMPWSEYIESLTLPAQMAQVFAMAAVENDLSAETLALAERLTEDALDEIEAINPEPCYAERYSYGRLGLALELAWLRLMQDHQSEVAEEVRAAWSALSRYMPARFDDDARACLGS